MHTDTLPPCPNDDLPEAKALLRLLSYAFIEANQLGLADCASLINQAASQVQFQMDLDEEIGPAVDLHNLH